MVKPLLEQLRTKVENAVGLTATTQAELLKLVADLERQTAGKAASQPPGQHPGIARLTTLVEEIEVTHPEITSLANRIATMLGNVGI